MSTCFLLQTECAGCQEIHKVVIIGIRILVRISSSWTGNILYWRLVRYVATSLKNLIFTHHKLVFKTSTSATTPDILWSKHLHFQVECVTDLNAEKVLDDDADEHLLLHEDLAELNLLELIDVSEPSSTMTLI